MTCKILSTHVWSPVKSVKIHVKHDPKENKECVTKSKSVSRWDKKEIGVLRQLGK